MLSTLGFGGLLIGISNQGDYGWSNYLTYLPVIVGIMSLVIFTIRQLKLEKPLLNLRVFKSKTFVMSIILLLIVFAAMTSSSMLVSLYMQSIRGYSALATGLLMLPGSLLMSILSPITGKAFDKYGARKVIIPGFALLGLGSLGFAFLGPDTSVVYLTVMYSIRMVGIAFALMPITTWGVNSLPAEDIASGSAIGSTLRQIGGSIGSAVFMSIMSSAVASNIKTMSPALANIKGSDISFFTSAVLIFIGLAVAVIFINDNKNKSYDELGDMA